MKKRMIHLALGIVVLLLAVQPKLLVHFCGDNFIALYLNQDPTTVASACGKRNKLHTSVDGAMNSCFSHSNSVESAQAEQCPLRQLTLIDVDADDFITPHIEAHSFEVEWQAVTLLLSEVAHYLLPHQDVAHLLYGKAPPHSPLPLTGRDILLRHATFLI